jgi:predicted transcriptional regulator
VPRPYCRLYYMARHYGDRLTSRLNERISPDMRASLEEIAERHDRTLSWVIRDALARYIRQERRRGGKVTGGD